MKTKLHLITTDMTYGSLQDLLKHSEESVYPLVNNSNERIFLCQIQRFALERHLFKHELAYRKSKTDTDSDESSDEDENELAERLKKINVVFDEDIKRISKRHKEENREKKKKKKSKKKRTRRT